MECRQARRYLRNADCRSRKRVDSPRGGSLIRIGHSNRSHAHAAHSSRPYRHESSEGGVGVLVKPKTAAPDWKKIRGWRKQLVHLLGTKGRVTARSRDGMPKPVSNATMEKREKRLFAALNELRRMGYKFKSLDSLQRRHIKALGTKWAKDGHSPSTIQNDLSMLRLLFQWIDKPEVMGESAEFVPSKQFVTRTTNAQYDHSWTAAGVDADRLIGLVSQYDRHVGIQLRLCHAFYLRRQEAVMFKTHQLDRTASTVQCLARCGRRPRRSRRAGTAGSDPQKSYGADETGRSAKGTNGRAGLFQYAIHVSIRSAQRTS